MPEAYDVEERGVDEASLAAYSAIPIAFTADSRLRVAPISGGSGGFAIAEERLASPVRKDYDAVGDRPAQWPAKFDVREWRLLLAFDPRDRGRSRPLGGLALVARSPEIRLLDGRADLALVWDVRVLPEMRGRGVGSALVSRAKELAKARGCTQLKVETQDLNIGACRFYESQGFRLGGVNLHAYRGQPGVGDETMMLYYAEL